MGYTIDFIDGIFVPNDIVPLVHVNSIQGTCRTVSSIANVDAEFPSTHRTSGVIVKATDNQKYYMYTNNNIAGFSNIDNWTELNSSTGTGTGTNGVDGASAFEVWQSQAGNENGTVDDFFAAIGGNATQWFVNDGISGVPGSPNYGDILLDSSTGNIHVYGTYASQPNQFNPFPVANISGPQGDPGTPGDPGLPGLPGTSVSNISYNSSNGEITFTLSDGTTFTTDDIRGTDGLPGAPGTGIAIQGNDTLTNILTKSGQVPGNLWVSTTAGSDSNGDSIAIGDGVVYTSSGAWVGVGQIQGPQGEPGTPGNHGTDGSTWFSGAGTPDNANGVNGDFFYDTTNEKIFKKTSSAWVEIADLTGKSAYEVWQDAGNSGDVATFLASLKGDTGSPGADADIVSVTVSSLPAGSVPTVTKTGTNQVSLAFELPAGNDGTPGTNGKSAYQEWLDAGNSGDENAFLASLIGPQGGIGDAGISVNGVTVSGNNIVFTMSDGITEFTLTDAMLQLKGDTGDTGLTVSAVAFSGNDMVFTLSDNTTQIVLIDAKITLKGEKGDAGSGVTIKGTNSITAITGLSTGGLTAGDMYISNNTGEANGIDATAGDGIVWTGTEWTNVGAIRGPQGEQGPTGAAGAAGSAGVAGAKITSAAFVGTDLVFTLDDASQATLTNGLTQLTGSTLHATGPFTASLVSSSDYVVTNEITASNIHMPGGNLSVGTISSSGPVTASGGLTVYDNQVSSRIILNTDSASFYGDHLTIIRDSQEIKTAQSNFIHNADQDDVSFIVRGALDGNLLTVNPQINERVGIGTNNPKAKLHVHGDISSSGTIYAPAIHSRTNEQQYKVRRNGPATHSFETSDDNHIFVRVSKENQYYKAGFEILDLESEITHQIYAEGDTGVLEFSGSGTQPKYKFHGAITASNLMMDGFPNVSASLAAAVAGGDDLGNHTALQPLNMNSNPIHTATDITASGIISASIISASKFGNILTDGTITANGLATFNNGFSVSSGPINAQASKITGNTIDVGFTGAPGGHITASGNISASGNIIGNEISGSIHTSSILDFGTEVSRSADIFGFGSGDGGGSGDGIFTTDGIEKTTTNDLNISGSVDIHTSSNDIVTYDSSTGLFNPKPVLTLAGNSIYTGETLTDVDGLTLTYNTQLSKDWFTFQGGLPRLGINVSNPKSSIHISGSYGSRPEIRLESSSTKMMLGIDSTGNSYISASNVYVSGSFTVSGSLNFPEGTDFVLSGTGQTELLAGASTMVIKHGATSVGKQLHISSSIYVEGDESYFRNRLVAPELVIFPKTSDSLQYQDTLYNNGGNLYWKGKQLLTSTFDNLAPTNGLYSPNSMQIYTTTANSRITLASNLLDIRAPIKSTRGNSLEINSILGLPVFEVTNSIAAIPTGSLRGGELVIIKPTSDVPGESGIRNISQDFNFIPCKRAQTVNPSNIDLPNVDTETCVRQRYYAQNSSGYSGDGSGDWVDYMYIDFIITTNPDFTMEGLQYSQYSVDATPGITGPDALLTIPAPYRPELNKILTVYWSQGTEQMRISSIEHRPPDTWRLRVERGWNNTFGQGYDAAITVNVNTQFYINYELPNIAANTATLYMYEPHSERWRNIPLGETTFKGS